MQDQFKKCIAKVFKDITLQDKNTREMYIATYLITMILTAVALPAAINGHFITKEFITKELVVMLLCGWVVGVIAVALIFKQMFKIYAEDHIEERRKFNAENEGSGRFFTYKQVFSSDELLKHSFSGIQGLTYLWICFITGMLVAVISMLVNVLSCKIANLYENFLKIAPKIKQ